MSRARLGEELFDVELFSLTGVERADAFVEFGAKAMKLLDMREQLLPDFLLIGIGKPRRFGNGAFERFDHVATLTR